MKLTRRVLIVDDEPDLREVVVDAMQTLGWVTVEASNGLEGLQFYLEGNFDLVISDVKMPGGDGISLVNAIRTSGNAQPAIFLMTGFSDLEGEMIEQLKVQKIFQKPFNFDDLAVEASRHSF